MTESERLDRLERAVKALIKSTTFKYRLAYDDLPAEEKLKRWSADEAKIDAQVELILSGGK